MRGKTAMALAGVAMLALAGCSSLQTPESSATQYVGKTRTEVVQALGEPTQAIPLPDTGGEMLIFAKQPVHYVVETGPDAIVRKAVEVK